MSARRWISAALLPFMIVGALTLAGSPPAGADDCPKNPGNPQGDDWCHQTPQPPPPTPAPTPVPTAAPTAAPTARPTERPTVTQRPARTQRPAAPSRTTAPDDDLDPDATPEPTPLDLGLEPASTPNITVQGPVFDTTPAPDAEPLDVAQPASAVSAGAWWFGIIVAFIIGFLIGRASWGLQKRRKQQLFG